MKIIDISVPLTADMPVWPGDVRPQVTQVKSKKKGDTSNDSKLALSAHAGTHIDAPRHFLDKGKTVDQIDLDVLIGPAFAVYLPEVAAITADILGKLTLPPGTRRLLFRTRNSELWANGVKEFKKDFVALTADAAQWIVDHGIRLVGIDYLSIQLYNEGPEVHQILMKAGVVILEGLNLAGVESGPYELICLPLSLAGVEASPARAVLVSRAKP